MVAMPLAMGQALSQHSNVIRRAAWTHYGFVVGQEGDSFILAFRDASDAVAFCLQVRGVCVFACSLGSTVHVSSRHAKVAHGQPQ